jgi:hypothetical protein
MNLTDKVIYSKDNLGAVFAIGRFSRLLYAGSKNQSYSAAPFELVGVNTVGGVVTVRLPLNPPLGCVVGVFDQGLALDTNPARVFGTDLSVNGNEGGLVLNQNRVYIEFVYIDPTAGWIVRSWVLQSAVPALGLVDEAAWTPLETSTWSSSAAVLGTEVLAWGNI